MVLAAVVGQCAVSVRQCVVLCGSGRVKQRNGIAGGAVMEKNELEVAVGSSYTIK